MRSRFHLAHVAFLCSFITSWNLQAQTVHDGVWWLARTKRERIVFLQGYFNALKFDANIEKGFPDTTTSIEKKVTNFYIQNSSKCSNLVIPMVFQICTENPDPKSDLPPSGGEEHPGKYSYCDGEYFRQMANRNRRKCFIEGYLECQKQYGKPEGTYAQSSDWYLDQLYQWFGISDGSDEINPDRTDFKIAEVLQAVNQAGGAANAQVARPKTTPSIQKTQPSKKTKRKGKQPSRESRVP